MMDNFSLNRNVTIRGEQINHVVKGAIERFYRDMNMTLEPCCETDVWKAGKIILKMGDKKPESYHIRVHSPQEIIIEAGSDLGFIYALIELSKRYLGVEPFWFWNDQKFIKKAEILIPFSEYQSDERMVEYRGWFINDEVLLSCWDAGVDAAYPWEMAFEALLRCGGNIVIPGTDQNSKRYAGMAASMGLWLTHHHAEPLGAEMFLRAYPDKTPSFKEHPDLFRKLWREGIERQEKDKVIWNLGFRGQGDTPFWEQDPLYDTPEKRGRLISDIMQEQYELVKQYIQNPVFCTNLYGEIMELYQQGFLTLPDHVIMIWADNGYGKMVSRRQGNHNPRVEALPEEWLKDHAHGVYYHVSFYDLQAANVLTMIPNSMDFVEKELTNAYNRGIKNLWLINCSNIKPHIYSLDYIASLWNGSSQSPDKHLDGYLNTYFTAESTAIPLDKMKECWQRYFKIMIPYGEREDEHAGEQFYNYAVRVLISGWMRDGGRRACEELNWCVPEKTFSGQLQWYKRICKSGYAPFETLLNDCDLLMPDICALWEESLLLQVRIHTYCLRGVGYFTAAFEDYSENQYIKAFYKLGQAAEWYQAADEAMKGSCRGKWTGFYENDCQTDIKETAYLLRQLMGYVRNLGDGPYFYQWQRMVIYPEADRKILLLLNEENHLTDAELYQYMKKTQNWCK